MRVLVTGATGFIGNHVVNELLRRQHKVIASSRSELKAKEAEWYSKVIYRPFNITGGESLTEEKLRVYEYFDKPDTIIHLAWEDVYQCESITHIEKNLFSHYFFLKSLIEGGVQELNVIGTCLEYGMKCGPLNEEMVPEPQVSYAVAKDTLRKFLIQLQHLTGFELKWIRLFYMYGPGQHARSLFDQLEKAILNNETVFNMSGGEQIRDYLSIEKVAEYIVRIALQNEVKGTINCCSGKPVSVRSIVEGIIAKAGKNNIKLNLGYYPYRNYEPMYFWGDNSKLEFVLSIAT